MRSNKEALDVILDIEQSVGVDKIKFKDIEIWPLIRLELWKMLREEAQRPAKKGSYLKNLWVKFQKRILLYAEYFSNKFKGQWEKTPAVFLIAPNERRTKVGGKYYSQFSNSLQEILDDMDIPYTTLDLGRKNLPVYGKTHFIDIEMIFRSKINKIKKIFIKEEEDIEHWNELQNYIDSKLSDLKLFKENVMNLSQITLDYQKIFEKILKKIEPKACFLVCYYHPAAMGYISAARNLGIKTVEIQHSQQELNAMYISWTKLAKNGYSLLPSFWWCWGKKSADNINDWSKPLHPKHRAIVGGNPWVAKNISSNYTNYHDDKFDKILKNKINVLVALQPITPVLGDNLIETISNSPEHINWLIRLHPAIYNKADEIRQQLEKTGNKNIDIKRSTEIPLFDLLKKVHFIITSWSSIAYEALPFKVHPIIIHENGADLFKEYINAKLFTYAPLPADILNTIKSNKDSFNFKEEIPYIETDRKKMKKIVLDLIGKSG